jgi:hypothetical protein
LLSVGDQMFGILGHKRQCDIEKAPKNADPFHTLPSWLLFITTRALFEDRSQAASRSFQGNRIPRHQHKLRPVRPKDQGAGADDPAG